MKALNYVLLCLLPCFILSGCWDKQELEEQAYVVVLGLDKAKNNMINITFQIANPQVGSTDKGSAPNEPSSDTVTFAAVDILSAKELANSVITRNISFAHLRTLIVSEELAKSDRFQQILESSIRDPEMRRETNIIVSREKAMDFIEKNKAKMETRPHKYYMFMQKRWRDTGLVPYSTLNRFFQRVAGELFLSIYATTERTSNHQKENEDNYIAGEIPQVNGDPVQIMGSAVFKNGRMIGKLTGEQTRYALLLRRKSLAHSFIASYPDPINPKYRISVRLIKTAATKIEIDVKKDHPVINVEIQLNVQVLSIPSLIGYSKDKEKQRQLKASLEKYMEDNSLQLIEQTQKQYEAEPFIWYIEARKKFWTMKEFEAYDWENKYKHAQVKVKYDVNLQNFGKQITTSQVGKGR